MVMMTWNLKLFDPWTGVIFVLGHGHIGHIQVVQIFLEMMSKEWSMKIVKFRIPRAWFSWDMLWPYWYFKVNWKRSQPLGRGSCARVWPIWSLMLSNKIAKFMIQDAKGLDDLVQSVYSLWCSDVLYGL